ncbi:MAG: DUF4417 domain-containing protein [Clostridiales bacterium]|nr:DUF4417 domain-containing protein [Clostridiales bacterium]
MIKNTTDLLSVADRLIEYLDGKIDFSKDGFPIFRKDMFLDSDPELIVPYYNRNNKIVTNPKKTVLCFFSSDSDLYRRLENVFDDIDEYKKCMGVIGLDITVTDDMDAEWQDMIMLANQLFLAVLACNGIKIIMNARIGSPRSVENLKAFPKGVIWATSFLGCDKLRSEYDFTFISKVLRILPSKLLIYGKHDIIAEKQLANMGIDYRVYVDMHRLTKGVA